MNDIYDATFDLLDIAEKFGTVSCINMGRNSSYRGDFVDIEGTTSGGKTFTICMTLKEQDKE